METLRHRPPLLSSSSLCATACSGSHANGRRSRLRHYSNGGDWRGVFASVVVVVAMMMMMMMTTTLMMIGCVFLIVWEGQQGTTGSVLTVAYVARVCVCCALSQRVKVSTRRRPPRSCAMARRIHPRHCKCCAWWARTVAAARRGITPPLILRESISPFSLSLTISVTLPLACHYAHEFSFSAHPQASTPRPRLAGKARCGSRGRRPWCGATRPSPTMESTCSRCCRVWTPPCSRGQLRREGLF